MIPEESANLIVAKTKVAPVKTQSFPLWRSLNRPTVKLIVSQLPIAPNLMHFLSDSRTVLDWLASHPSKWQVFVASQISEIINSFPSGCWRHVESPDNPADCATRGHAPEQLVAS